MWLIMFSNFLWYMHSKIFCIEYEICANKVYIFPNLNYQQLFDNWKIAICTDYLLYLLYFIWHLGRMNRKSVSLVFVENAGGTTTPISLDENYSVLGKSSERCMPSRFSLISNIYSLQKKLNLVWIVLL